MCLDAALALQKRSHHFCALVARLVARLSPPWDAHASYDSAPKAAATCFFFLLFLPAASAQMLTPKREGGGRGWREREKNKNLLNHLYWWRNCDTKPLGLYHNFGDLLWFLLRNNSYLTEELVEIKYYQMQSVTLVTRKWITVSRKGIHEEFKRNWKFKSIFFFFFAYFWWPLTLNQCENILKYPVPEVFVPPPLFFFLAQFIHLLLFLLLQSVLYVLILKLKPFLVCIGEDTYFKTI